jgi:hypothetical protein
LPDLGGASFGTGVCSVLEMEEMPRIIERGGESSLNASQQDSGSD